MKTVVFCSSATFYEHVNALAAELETRGFRSVVPMSARRMQRSGNYDVTALRSWYKNPEDFSKKTALMRGHFKEVAEGDLIAVINDAKHGIVGYIGPNVLMEMGLAFYLNKPIYVLNNIGEDMPVYEEVLGMNSIFLDGNIDRIPKEE